MNEIKSFKQRVQNITNGVFDQLALEIFKFQSENCKIYKDYLQSLQVEPSTVFSLEDIPFLPIEFFKNHVVKTQDWNKKLVFMSSGTTGSVRSQHHIEDDEFYLSLSRKNFEDKFGPLNETDVYALLPSYQEQGNSSLIAMVDNLIKYSRQGGFFLNDFRALEQKLKQRLDKGATVVLFGVGYALLDFSESLEAGLDGLVLIETGGMKGRREEITKAQFYSTLRAKMGAIDLCSEYGMTELLSQAYSKGALGYQCVPQMKVMIRDLNDPFSWVPYNKSGQINVIDLANVHSCSFIETQDIGRMNENGYFEVLGRKDNSDIRGCNLMIG